MGSIREQIVTGLLASAALALFWWLVAAPSEARMLQLREEVRGLSTEIIQRDQMGRTACTTEVKLQDRRPQLASMAARIPGEVRLGGFLEQLADASEHADLRFVDVAPQTPYSAQGLGILPIRVTFESTFSSLHRFLRRIESLERVVHLSAVETSRVDEESSVLSTELTLQVFFGDSRQERNP